MKKSRIILGIIAMIFIFLSSCKKRTYTCQFNYYYLRLTGLAFEGFQASELNTIVLNRYVGFTNFTEFIGTDTLHFTDSLIWLANDTAYYKRDSIKTKGYFWIIEDSIDYKVELPLSNKSYTISGTSKGPAFTEFQSDQPCRGRTDVLALQNIHIDGNLVFPAWNTENAGIMFLFLNK